MVGFKQSEQIQHTYIHSYIHLFVNNVNNHNRFTNSEENVNILLIFCICVIIHSNCEYKH